MKKSKCERPVWQIVLGGVLSALMVLLLLSAIAAMLVLNGVLPVKSIPAAAAVLAAVGAFCGKRAQISIRGFCFIRRDTSLLFSLRMRRA